MPKQVAVMGAGSWGTALAIHAARAGHQVRLWGHDPGRVAAMRELRSNTTYLPGFDFPSNLEPGADPREVLAGAHIVISAVPSKYLRATWERIGQGLAREAHLISATKGVERDSGLRMTEVLASALDLVPASLSALSGPSFAHELAAGCPTAVTLGCEDAAAAATIQAALSHGPLRVYRSADLTGVEFGGALKNVIAIAAGIADGLQLGTNPRAALICRGLKEMAQLAGCMGGDPATLMGLSGLGDLVLTCTGPLSRNRSVGMAIGKGQTLQDVVVEMEMVAEGVVTVCSTRQLARRQGVEMPITEQVYEVLYKDKDPRRAIEELMARRLVDE